MQQWKAVTWVIPSSLARTSPCRPGVRNSCSLPCLISSPMASKARAGSPANENQASVNIRGWSIGRLVLCRVRIAVDRICRRRYGRNMRENHTVNGKKAWQTGLCQTGQFFDCVRKVNSLTVSERSALWHVRHCRAGKKLTLECCQRAWSMMWLYGFSHHAIRLAHSLTDWLPNC